MITSFGLFFGGGDGGNRNRVQNRLTKGSTSVVYRLSYPLTYRRQTAYTLRYPLIPDESRGALPFMFATKSTLCPKPWHSLGERKLLITQRELLIYCCQLILKLRILWRFRTAARLPRFEIPVETFTSPWVCWFIYHTPNVYSCQLVIHVAFLRHNQVVVCYEQQSPSCVGDFHQQEP